MVAADNLRFYWASLTSSPRLLFSDINFWIFILNCWLSWSFWSILLLYYWSSWIIFWFWLADSLKFYWAFCTSPYIELFSFTNLMIFSCNEPIVLFITSISDNFLVKFPNSMFFFSITPFSLSTSCERMEILLSDSPTFLLTSPTYWSLLWRASISLQAILSSLLSLPICEAESLMFSWAFLTSSPRLLF